MKRGEIYFLLKEQLINNSVQAGLRPVIVVQNDIGNHFSPTTIVCSITSAKKKSLPTHLYIGTSGGLYKESTILCEQIQTVDKKDLKSYVGCITDQTILNALNYKILISLGIADKTIIKRAYLSKQSLNANIATQEE